MVFESKRLRRILRIGWRERVRNEEVRRRGGLTTNIVEKTRDFQRSWFFHVERMSGDRMPRLMMYTGMGGGPRSRGDRE